MELSSRQVEEYRFGFALNGYRRRDVDAFLTECSRSMSALEERLRIAEVGASKSDDELIALRTDIDDLLAEATAARRTIIQDAKAEAETIARYASSLDGTNMVADASAHAAAILKEAETTAQLTRRSIEQARGEAEAAAAETLRNAEIAASRTQAEADSVLDKARMDAHASREETEAMQASMDAQLAEIRRLLEAARVGGTETEDLVVDLRSEPVHPSSVP